MSSTLKDYILEGGQLMVVLAGIFFVVLALAVYAALLFCAEARRARWFRRSLHVENGVLTRTALLSAAANSDALPARYLRELDDEILTLELGSESPLVRDQQSRDVEDRVLGALEWPLDLLHFLGTYAAKIGLCGTILGLCMHFLAFGTDSDSEMAARAMAVALYTTLGALTIALVAEPAAYVLGWSERWFRADLRRWARSLEESEYEEKVDVSSDEADDDVATEDPACCDSEPVPLHAAAGESGVA